MEVEWTLGSVIANAGNEIEILEDVDTITFDSRLVTLCIFLTLVVAAFVFRSTCFGQSQRKGRGDKSASRSAWSSFLTAGFTSKAAFLVRV
jgi:hypothetical protein